jgi:serine/threonine protein kinase
MRGGVISKTSPEEISGQVYRILGHKDTRIEFISRGEYGQLFRVIYPGTDSGFIDESKGEVKVFILKVQGIDMRIRNTFTHEVNRSRADYENFNDLYPYSKISTWEELSNEVRLQQKIYTCALDKQLMPPCPAILFHGAITAKQFEMFAPGQLVYKVGDDDQLVRAKLIDMKDYNHYRMGIIFMEYIHSVDLALPEVKKRYDAKFQEIESKALRAYCTALQCGVLQGDPKPQNFLLTEDDNVVLIDFGIARELDREELVEIDKLVEKAAAGDSEELRLKLTELEPYDNKCLDRLIFRPRWKDSKLIKSGITKYPTLAPAITLSKEIADHYKVGLYVPTSTLPDRESLSPEIVESTTQPSQERPSKKSKSSWNPFALGSAFEDGTDPLDHGRGGKRHTKYVGTRKKTRKRRKV